VSRLRRLAPLAGVALFCLALGLLYHELSNIHLSDVLRVLRAIPRERLLLALALTILGYATMTGYDALAIHALGRSLPYRRIALASFLAYSVSNTLGHPLFTGTPLRARLYSGWGLSAVEIARIVAFGFLTFWLGFLTLAGASFAFEPMALPTAIRLPEDGVRPLGMVFLTLVGGWLAVAVLRKKPLTVRGVEVPVPGLPTALAQIALSSLDWLLAAAVLHTLLPPRSDLPFPAFVGCFLLAQIAGILSQVPGGLGVFETTLVLLLPHSGAEALGAVLAFRIVYYLLPVAVALIVLAGYEIGRHSPPPLTAPPRVRRVGGWISSLVPPVLALGAFLAGMVLLVSGATPGAGSRMASLNQWVPLAVIEASHFAGSLAGTGLLFLALGLMRRLEEAYRLALALLAAGIAASLLKGLDWEEALILGFLLVALLPCRQEFYRQGSLTREPFTGRWLAAVAVVLAGSLWLGLFAYRHVEYSPDLWWRFSLQEHAPRFLRATVGAAVLAVAVGVVRLLRPVPPRPAPPSADDLGRAEALARRSPRTYAFLSLLGDKQLLFPPGGDADAFLMYAVQGRTWVSMGDPVGEGKGRIELLWDFRNLCHRYGGWPAFYQVAERDLHLYVDLGLSLLKLGEEGRVPLAGFSLEGSKRKGLRHARNKIQEEGCRFEIVEPPGVEALLPELKAVSDDWMSGKSAGEKGFSLGFFDPVYLARFPVAVARRGERIVAFANLWPGAPGEELSIDLMRYSKEAPQGVMDYLFTELMLWGRERGYAWFSLGMAPLSGLEPRALAPLWSRAGSLLFRHGEHFYNFQGLRRYKEKFDPVWEPRYLASTGGWILPAILADLTTLIGGGVRGVFFR
jgi:phosphatidylglycerol lysyltransferase